MYSTLKTYYSIVKPNIIYSNIVTTSAGFMLASRGHIDIWLLAATLVGISGVIGASAVLNNYIDRDIDVIMDRTKHRAFPQGRISKKEAFLISVFFFTIGIVFLAFFTNLLTLCLALLGSFFYVVIYSLWLKRTSVHGTLAGSISGAVPPLVGYCAVSNSFDIGAVLLFIILCLWQMPHFYAMAIYRGHEYAAAGIPVLPVVRSSKVVTWQIFLYTAAFGIAAMHLTIFKLEGLLYAAVVGAASLTLTVFAATGFFAKNNNAWARKMFLYSILMLFILSVMISIDVVK